MISLLGGDLAVEHDHACLAVVEVTDDCNLSCSYCFASSGPGGKHRSTEEIDALLDTVDVLLAECVLCLTDIEAALGEANRVLRDSGRLALSDVVVDGDRPEIPESVADALCLTGARSRERLTARVETAGFDVEHVADHHDDLLAMRDRVTERVNYEGLLGLIGERGERALAAIEDLEGAVEAGDVSYVSLVATSQD